MMRPGHWLSALAMILVAGVLALALVRGPYEMHETGGALLRFNRITGHVDRWSVGESRWVPMDRGANAR